tara:strand:- start:495 stop:707 length:213 start_codon:yes stop_codon:yes gene_type:complete
MINQQYFKYHIYNKETKENKFFIKYEEVREYCNISRPILYKIFNGATPREWVNSYEFKQVRLPKYIEAVY